MLLVSVINVLVLLVLLPMSQELIHWLIIVGIHISIAKYDINDSVSLDFL